MQVEIPLDDIIQKKVQEAVAEALKQDRLYTVKDLAQRYQCSEDTIRRDIRDGKFVPAFAARASPVLGNARTAASIAASPSAETSPS